MTQMKRAVRAHSRAKLPRPAPQPRVLQGWLPGRPCSGGKPERQTAHVIKCTALLSCVFISSFSSLRYKSLTCHSL